MALEGVLPAVPRPFALARGLTARVGLTLVVVASFAVRTVATAAHPVPLYFPDEYLYTAIARSLGSGHLPAVRGTPAHFPALLEPLLAAPFQALASPHVAYALTRAGNALFMSLAAVPVYMLARNLRLSSRYALACAVFAVAIPDLVYSSFVLTDPIAYPLVLAAIASGVAAIDKPSRRTQFAFLAFALLAAAARAQYVVVPAAFVAGALVVDRRRILASQRTPLILFSLPCVAAVALGPGRLLGYYSNVVNLHLGGRLLSWAGVDLFLLALAAGVVVVPGAVIALARPRGRTERAFAALVVAYAAGVLLEAALYASNGSARFQERYLFTLLPLVPVAFGLYLKHGRPHRFAVTAVSAVLLMVAARVPLSGYAGGAGNSDSPFLFAVSYLELHVGIGNGSLLVALLAGIACVGAVAVAWRGGGYYALGAATAAVVVTSIGATIYDAETSTHIRHQHVAANPSWVDATGLRDVTVLQTAGSPAHRLFEPLFWNRSLTHEARLGAAVPTDVYAAPRVRIASDGTLGGVGSNVLLQEYAATATFANARLVARAGTLSLWSAEGAPRLALLEQGRYSDGWLSRSGRLTVWPDAAGNTRGTLRFTLSLPPDGVPTTVAFGKAHYDIDPGERTTVIYTLDARGPWSLDYKLTHGGNTSSNLRLLSVRSTPPVLERAGAPVQRATTQA